MYRAHRNSTISIKVPGAAASGAAPRTVKVAGFGVATATGVSPRSESPELTAKSAFRTIVVIPSAKKAAAVDPATSAIAQQNKKHFATFQTLARTQDGVQASPHHFSEAYNWFENASPAERAMNIGNRSCISNKHNILVKRDSVHLVKKGRKYI